MFTDDEMKRLEAYLYECEREGKNNNVDDKTLKALLARLEASDQLAYALESFCEVECPDCGKELDDPHESDCETGKHLEAWRKAKGER